MISKSIKTVLVSDCFQVLLSGVDKKTKPDERLVFLCNYTDVYHNREITSSLTFMEASANDSEIKKLTLQTADILITKDSETPEDIAVPAYVPQNLPGVVCGYHLAILRPKSDEVCSRYFAYLLQTRKTRHYFYTLANGVTRYGLTLSAISSARLALPPFSEQTRISKLLFAWDRAIELTEQLIVARRYFKHALMQKVVDDKNSQWPSSKIGELFDNRKEKGSSGLPTYSVTINFGLVPRDSLDRKNDTSLRPEQHLLVEKDDIAYNMMRMWQGASGLAPESGLVSPAYVVLRSRGEVDPLFASYWFKMPRVVKKFEDYSHGLTKDRLRLYYKDFASITLPVPPLPLQKKIAKVMQCCDQELGLLQQKLDLLRQQKKGLMQQLLTGKVRVKVPKEAV